MQTYSDATKAQILAEWSVGGATKTLARQHGIPESTVRNWTHGLTRALVTPEKRHDIDGLYTEFVAEALVGLRTLARRSQDEDWLAALPPKDAYLWFGTLADKVLAALSAYQSASERDDGA